MKKIKALFMITTWMLTQLLQFTLGANILTLMAFGSKSHKAIFTPLLAELSKRGHEITFVNPFDTQDALKNSKVREIHPLKAVDDFRTHSRPFGRDTSIPQYWQRTLLVTTRICNWTYTDLEFQNLLKDKSTKYDLVIIDALFNECMLPLIHHFQAPFIYLSTSAPPPWVLAAVGAPNAFSYVPGLLGTYTSDMTFWERVSNVWDSLFHMYYRKYVLMPYWNDFVRKLLPDTPDIREIENNVSLVLTNTHPGITYQFPSNPSIVEVGAMHCKPAKPLPQDLEDFVNGSGDHGFIIFSFGSVLRGVEIPTHEREMFVKAFSRIPQRVIWKWETDAKIAGLSDNVRLVKWLPQQDLLSHEKIKAFITHGGLLSTQESVYHGSPLIGIPIFGDQAVNLAKAAKDEYAIHLDRDTLSEEKIYQAIQSMVNNSSYGTIVRRLSDVLKDQPETPVQRGVYWVEYVIRHQGASHLRSPARDLSFFQIYMLDIFLAFAIVAQVLIAVLVVVLWKLKKWFSAS